MSRFVRTREALAVYDAGKPERQARWDKVIDLRTLDQAAHEDAKAAKLVQEAFYQDTKDVNHMGHAKLVSPDDPWLRNLVAKDKEENP